MFGTTPPLGPPGFLLSHGCFKNLFLSLVEIVRNASSFIKIECKKLHLRPPFPVFSRRKMSYNIPSGKTNL